jgi:hypothetical protein
MVRYRVLKRYNLLIGQAVEITARDISTITKTEDESWAETQRDRSDEVGGCEHFGD